MSDSDPNRMRRLLTITPWILTALVVALCLVVVTWRRDSATVDSQLRALGPAVAAFQQNIRTYRRTTSSCGLS